MAKAWLETSQAFSFGMRKSFSDAQELVRRWPQIAEPRPRLHSACTPNNALVFKVPGSEVDQQPSLKSAGFQVVDHLREMDGRQRLERLGFDEDRAALEVHAIVER